MYIFVKLYINEIPLKKLTSKTPPQTGKFIQHDQNLKPVMCVFQGKQLCSLRMAFCCSFTDVSLSLCHKRSKREIFWHFIPFLIQTIIFFSSTADPQMKIYRESAILPFQDPYSEVYISFDLKKHCPKKDKFLYLHNIHFQNYIMKTHLPLFCVIVYFLLLLHNLPEWFFIERSSDCLL